LKLLLVGNYELGDAKSMPRFGEMLRREMVLRGHEVLLLRPKAVFGGIASGSLGKWLGYVDQYLIFLVRLWLKSSGWDAVHICDHSNAVYAPWVRGVNASITCHDLLGIQAGEGRFPEQRVGSTGRMQQRWIKRNLLAIKRVVCVSANTARELAAMGSNSELVVIPNCLNNEFAPVSEDAVREVRAKVGLGPGERFLLQVGGNLWYKNRPGMLRIFAELVKREGFQDLRFVMAGHPFTDELRAETNSLGLEGKVIELQDPDDATVRGLYTGAALLLFASLHEGFGWPIVEGQSCGCPVATSDADPMRDVAGGAAILVDPRDPVSAADVIANDWPRRAAMREDGFCNVQRFTREAVMGEYEAFFLRGKVSK
jgi:glycosyltransferase involved in cell wall biosynthesis